MTLLREDFDEFFAAVNGGHRPFRWQRRLLHHVLDTGAWPEQIGAPTGSGKSNVVDVHVFANALAAIGVGPRVPRRLAVVVNRRALVDTHYLRAMAIRELLERDGLQGVNAAIRDALRSLRVVREWAVGERQPLPSERSALEVVQLRGGVAPERGWLDDPCACAVIAATPDMWGSRLLMRGYGSRSYAWPREAGMFAFDSVVVIDEAHLNRQLVVTARRVGQLEALAPAGLGVPVLQVVETTATPDDRTAATSVGVEQSDLRIGADDALVARLTRPKSVRLQPSPAWPSMGKASQAHIDCLVAEVTALFETRNADPRPAGCIVNRVDTAVRVAEALSAAGVRTATWVGRRRPADIDELVRSHPDLFSSINDDDATVDVLVATQTVEVGVDLDLFGLVTELASGSALAQRAGRVNRIGRSDSATVVVVVPSVENVTDDYLPYVSQDLDAALSWLRGRQQDGDGLSPTALSFDPPPAESPRRMLFQRPELYDAWWWSHTSEELFAPSELSLYLRDDLRAETATAGLVLRDFGRVGVPDGDDLPDQSVLMSLVQATLPAPRETFDVMMGDLAAILERAMSDPELALRTFVVRDGVVTSMDGPETLIRPGDVVVLPVQAGCTREGVPVRDPVPSGTLPATFWGDEGVELADEQWNSVLAGLSAERAQEAFLENGGAPDQQVVLPPGADTADVLAWVVIKPRAVVLGDTEQLQESVLGLPVSLAQHRTNVEHRMRAIATAVGLPDHVVDAAAAAARLHDEGKRDIRFQRRLGAPVGASEVLAKSGRKSAQQAIRDAAAAGLRRGWRHEQLSAAIVSGVHGDLPNIDLVVRLVGTSHGRGRGIFDHPPRELSPERFGSLCAAAAENLFGANAGWERLVEQTEAHWGVWGCAYLEALLRAADCQISGEGS